jgi:hypothetical protein
MWIRDGGHNYEEGQGFFSKIATANRYEETWAVGSNLGGLDQKRVVLPAGSDG